jgi:DNA-directed RNA polymerase specialized sigma24 family protein
MAAAAADWLRRAETTKDCARSLYMNAPFAGKRGESAFAQLCDELRPDLFRFAFWLARDREVAEDVVQEALLRAWRSREALAEGAAAKPWLLTIVRREQPGGRARRWRRGPRRSRGC